MRTNATKWIFVLLCLASSAGYARERLACKGTRFATSSELLNADKKISASEDLGELSKGAWASFRANGKFSGKCLEAWSAAAKGDRSRLVSRMVEETGEEATLPFMAYLTREVAFLKRSIEIAESHFAKTPGADKFLTELRHSVEVVEGLQREMVRLAHP